MNEYLINAVNTYRVSTVEDALELRDKLRETLPAGCSLNSFTYTTKYDKTLEEDYQVVKVKMIFNTEKAPEQYIPVVYGEGDNE